MANIIKELLDAYRVNRDFQKEIRETYRNSIKEVLSSLYDTGVRFIYGGSLAKGTANTNSCDIDLICYVNCNTNMTLKEIYETTAKALEDNNYLVNRKNSAIELTGKIGENSWDTTVDVVPGRYIKDSQDVNLWNNREQKTLKTNPEKQINKVKESNSKDLIRIVKLFREFNNLRFKSFFLEIFIIDIVEEDFQDGDDIQDKLVHFCNHSNDIGTTKIFDPANFNNDIMKIHNEHEYGLIRSNLDKLRLALLTDDDESIRKCILGVSYNVSESYKNNARNHSSLIKFDNALVLYNIFRISGFYSYDDSYNNSISENIEININSNLKFVAYVLSSFVVNSVTWIICNSGYEARKASQLRGNKLERSNKIDNVSTANHYIKFESTLYYGDHYAQAKLETTTGKIYMSNIITVKIRK
jgi:hypothetical protein